MRKSKNSKAPKRFRTAYILFSNEKRDQLKSENPGLSPKEIITELGARWKSADVQTKEYFKKLSDDEKKEYEEKRKNYKIEQENAKQNQSMEVNSSQ